MAQLRENLVPILVVLSYVGLNTFIFRKRLFGRGRKSVANQRRASRKRKSDLVPGAIVLAALLAAVVMSQYQAGGSYLNPDRPLVPFAIVLVLVGLIVAAAVRRGVWKPKQALTLLWTVVKVVWVTFNPPVQPPVATCPVCGSTRIQKNRGTGSHRRPPWVCGDCGRAFSEPVLRR